MIYDVTIIGGGPAGIAAALTCANQGMHCLLISDRRGGKLGDITHLTNWFGDSSTNGRQFAKALYDQLAKQETHVTLQQSNVTAIQTAVSKEGTKLFRLGLQGQNLVLAKTLIIATGTKQKQLGIPGEQALLGKGVSYCATCDIPYFRAKTIALISDDVFAFKRADELAKQAASVYLLTSVIGGSPSTNVRIINAAYAERIVGKERVTGLVYRDSVSKQANQLSVDGVFIECGQVGNSLMVSRLVNVDDSGFVKVDHASMATSEPGIYVAGDITNGHYKQVVIAMADGTKAALSAKKYINAKEII